MSDIETVRNAVAYASHMFAETDQENPVEAFERILKRVVPELPKHCRWEECVIVEDVWPESLMPRPTHAYRFRGIRIGANPVWTSSF